jgi:predicted DNA binding CopG/RHH family protein
MKKTKINLTLSPVLVDRIKKEAAKTDRSFCLMVERIIKKYFRIGVKDEH